MDKTRVTPDWLPLRLEEVRALLLRYEGCGEPIEIRSVSPRPFSAASVVSTSHKSVFIKRHAKLVRDREGLLEEHRFLQHLFAHGAPVARVLATTGGETAVEIGDWTYEVHEATAEVDIYQDALSWTPFLSSHHAFSAGQALARLHLAAEGFVAPARKAQPLITSFFIFAGTDPTQGPTQRMERYLRARPSLDQDAATRKSCAEALELLAPFHARLRPLLPSLAPLWTHNDLHASNLLWSNASLEAEAVKVIDFGLADRTNAVHDIAQMIERNVVEWLELSTESPEKDTAPVHLDHLQAMLDGYQSVRRLSDAEAAALAPMTALCHAEFALTEADYFLGVLHSEANAIICHDGYLVGHARWFHGAGGQRLLQAIEEWAEQVAKRARETVTGPQNPPSGAKAQTELSAICGTTKAVP
jgi:Ser/Thr protein kinase RdoA (MazF antagonist)